MGRIHPSYFVPFWKEFKRVSESVFLDGCGTSNDIAACIEKQIEGGIKYRTAQLKKAKSQREKEEIRRKILNLVELINHEFAQKAAFEYRIDSHPIFREVLGSKDDLAEPKFYKKKKKS